MYSRIRNILLAGLLVLGLASSVKAQQCTVTVTDPNIINTTTYTGQPSNSPWTGNSLSLAGAGGGPMSGGRYNEASDDYNFASQPLTPGVTTTFVGTPVYLSSAVVGTYPSTGILVQLTNGNPVVGGGNSQPGREAILFTVNKSVNGVYTYSLTTATLFYNPIGRDFGYSYSTILSPQQFQIGGLSFRLDANLATNQYTPYTSPDGTNWTQVANPITANIGPNQIANAGYYVDAGGAGNYKAIGHATLVNVSVTTPSGSEGPAFLGDEDVHYSDPSYPAGGMQPGVGQSGSPTITMTNDVRGELTFTTSGNCSSVQLTAIGQAEAAPGGFELFSAQNIYDNALNDVIVASVSSAGYLSISGGLFGDQATQLTFGEAWANNPGGYNWSVNPVIGAYGPFLYPLQAANVLYDFNFKVFDIFQVESAITWSRATGGSFGNGAGWATQIYPICAAMYTPPDWIPPFLYSSLPSTAANVYTVGVGEGFRIVHSTYYGPWIFPAGIGTEFLPWAPRGSVNVPYCTHSNP